MVPVLDLVDKKRADFIPLEVKKRVMEVTPNNPGIMIKLAILFVISSISSSASINVFLQIKSLIGRFKSSLLPDRGSGQQRSDL